MKIFADILQSVGIDDAVHNVAIVGNDPVLPSPFMIGEAGAAAIAAVGYLAAELWHMKTGQRQQVGIRVRDAAIAQRSHEYLQVLDGPHQDLWNPISGFYQTQDNQWIQFHCNFPHHLQGVIALLGCENTKESVTEAVRHWQSAVLEQMSATPAYWERPTAPLGMDAPVWPTL